MSEMINIGARSKEAQRILAKSGGSTIDKALNTIATALEKNSQFILEENPVIRFYLAEGQSKEAYTFKYGNTTLIYSGEGSAVFNGVTYNYVDISLYAYQLTGDITYTDGINSGSYHFNSYVDFVTTDEAYKNNTNLITLVEKLYNYSMSAEAYRASVIGK